MGIFWQHHREGGGVPVCQEEEGAVTAHSLQVYHRLSGHRRAATANYQVTINER